MTTSVELYRKALDALDEALRAPKTSIVRDASIQRFEFCVELARKTAKKVMGTASSAPRTVIREMADAGLVDDPKAWFGFLDARNLSVHTYNEALAEQVYATACEFLSVGRLLLQRLEGA